MVSGAALGAALLQLSVAAPLTLCAVVSGSCAVLAHLGLRRNENG
jgi:hypothetical protein